MKNRITFLGTFLVIAPIFLWHSLSPSPSFSRRNHHIWGRPASLINLSFSSSGLNISCSPFHAHSQQNKHVWVICTLNYLSFLFVLLSHLCSVVSLSCCVFSYQRNNKSKWCMNPDFSDNKSNAHVFALLLFTYQHKDVSQNLWLMLFSSDPTLLL